MRTIDEMLSQPASAAEHSIETGAGGWHRVEKAEQEYLVSTLLLMGASIDAAGDIVDEALGTLVLTNSKYGIHIRDCRTFLNLPALERH